MGSPLRVLLVEDSEDDSLLVQRHLKRGGYELTLQRVETREAMDSALDAAPWDLVLCDYTMPLFSGPEALQLVKEHSPDLPFIIITAAIGDESAAAIMKAGAHDYVLKHKLGRLIPVIQRSLQEAELRRERHHALQSAKESEERYQALFERSLDCVYVCDLAGNFIDANPMALELLGYTRDEIGDLNFASLLPDQEQLVCAMASLQQTLALGAQPAPNMYRLRTKGGGEVFVESTSAIIYRNGEPYAVQGIARDVTARRRAEQALREREELLSRITSNMLDIVSLTDLQGNILWASPSHTRVLGLTPEQMQQRPLLERVHPDDMERVMTVLAQGAPEGRMEFRYQHAQGHYLWLESIGRVVSDETGALSGVVFGSRDVTERHRAEAAMRRSEQRLSATLDSIADGVIATDERGCVARMNPAAEQLIGRSLAECAGRPLAEVFQLIESDSGAIVADPVARLTQGEPNGATHRQLLVGANGQTRTIAPSTAVILDSEGESGGLVIVIHDVTEQVLLEQQVRLSHKMEAVGRLASGVAHEFHNLLGVVAGYCDVVGSELTPDDPVRDDLREIATAAERGTALTRQLMALSGSRRSPPRVVDAGAVINGLAPMLRRLLSEEIELDIQIEGRAPVFIDPGQLEHVLLNLALNGRDAMPRGGTLALRLEQASEEDASIQLLVSDTGCGMDEVARTRLFEPFSTTKADLASSGRGLSAALEILQQAGGAIEVQSALGLGSTFCITLPRATPEDMLAERAAGALTVSQSGVILVVEDDAALLSLLSRVLGRSGYRVLEARHGLEALSAVEREDAKVDLLVTDVVLPQLGGCELYQRLRELQPEVKVLYMSGYTDQTLLDRGVQADLSPFIQKPFSAQALLQRVRDVMAGGRP